MSMFEDRQYRWRETYFVLFRSHNRPKLKAVQKALSALNSNYQLTNLTCDRQGRLESLTLISPDDFAALDVCYTEGAEVLEQGATLAQDIKPPDEESSQQDSIGSLVQCDARFDVLHFERVAEYAEEDDDAEEMLDPSTLLLVLGELARLTEGIAVDPQAGAILSDE